MVYEKARTHAVTAIWAFGGAPYGAMKRVSDVPKRDPRTHANNTTWAFSGAPCWATILVRGAPKWAARRRAGAASGGFG